MKKLTLIFVLAVAAAASYAVSNPSRVTPPVAFDDPIPVCPPECGNQKISVR